MKQDESRMGSAILLPMAVSADLRPRLDFKKSGLTFWQAREPARPEARGDGHQVGIAESFVRDKFFHTFMVGTQGAARKRPARHGRARLGGLTRNVDAAEIAT